MQAAAVYARLLGYWLILAVVTLAIPGPADGQTADRVYRLGALMLSAGSVERVRAYLLPVLARQGFAEGRNLVLEVRIGTVGELPALAGELLATKPDVILANGLMAIRATERSNASGSSERSSTEIRSPPVAAGLARPAATSPGRMLAPEPTPSALSFARRCPSGTPGAEGESGGEESSGSTGAAEVLERALPLAEACHYPALPRCGRQAQGPGDHRA
jgi:hypothetical protein